MVEGLIISIRRHCQKEGDRLSPKGREDAENIGKSIEIPALGMVGYHSDANRTRETAECIFEGAGIEPRIIPAEFGGVNLLGNIVPYMNQGWPSDLSYTDAVLHCLKNEPGAMEIVGHNLAEFIEEMVKIHAPNNGLRIEAISHGPNLEGYIFHALGNTGIGLIKDGLHFKEGQNLIYHPGREVIEIPHIGSEYHIK